MKIISFWRWQVNGLLAVIAHCIIALWPHQQPICTHSIIHRVSSKLWNQLTAKNPEPTFPFRSVDHKCPLLSITVCGTLIPAKQWYHFHQSQRSYWNENISPYIQFDSKWFKWPSRVSHLNLSHMRCLSAKRTAHTAQQQSDFIYIIR